MGFGHLIPAGQEHYDEDTLFKVWDALREDAGLTEKQTRTCINALRAKGILFREKALTSAPAKPVCRSRDLEDNNVSSSDDNQTPS
jgi:hypothetical protein